MNLLLEISPDIAESAATSVGADAFITNDVKLKQVSEIKAIVLKDYT